MGTCCASRERETDGKSSVYDLNNTKLTVTEVSQSLVYISKFFE